VKIKVNKNILNISLIVSIFIALFSYMIIVDGWANVVIIVKQIEPIWFVAARLIVSNLLDIRGGCTSYSY